MQKNLKKTIHEDIEKQKRIWETPEIIQEDVSQTNQIPPILPGAPGQSGAS
ncbi:MAG: hypothetical protein WD098_04990 [Balneolales bacterium]